MDDEEKIKYIAKYSKTKFIMPYLTGASVFGFAGLVLWIINISAVFGHANAKLLVIVVCVPIAFGVITLGVMDLALYAAVRVWFNRWNIMIENGNCALAWLELMRQYKIVARYAYNNKISLMLIGEMTRRAGYNDTASRLIAANKK